LFFYYFFFLATRGPVFSFIPFNLTWSPPPFKPRPSSNFPLASFDSPSLLIFELRPYRLSFGLGVCYTGSFFFLLFSFGLLSFYDLFSKRPPRRSLLFSTPKSTQFEIRCPFFPFRPPPVPVFINIDYKARPLGDEKSTRYSLSPVQFCRNDNLAFLTSVTEPWIYQVLSPLSASLVSVSLGK